MKKLYRIEVSTFWHHPKLETGRWRHMVYNFQDNELDQDQRTWADGQDFYDPKHSPEIYAEKDRAKEVYDELDYLLEDWPQLSDVIYEGSGEQLVSYHLVAVDTEGNETTEAEFNLAEVLAELNGITC